MPKNDFTATAGITLEQWQKDIASMDGSISKIEARSAQLESKLGKVGSALKGGAVLAALGSFGDALAKGGADASEMTSAMKALDKEGFGSGPEKHLHKYTSGLLDVAGAVDSTISSIPILGKVWNTITAPITATAKYTALMRETDVLINTQAEGTQNLSAKYKALSEQRAKVFGKSTMFVFQGDDKKADKLKNLDAERARTAEKYISYVEREKIAGNAILAGSQKESDLMRLRVDREKELTKLREEAKDKHGDVSPDRQRALNAAEKAVQQTYAANKSEIEAHEKIRKIDIQGALKTAETRYDGLKGAADAAAIALDVAEKEEAASQGLTEEAKEQAAVKKAEAFANKQIADRSLAVAKIQNTYDADLIEARQDGLGVEIKAADAAIKAAKAKQLSFTAGTTESDAAINEEASARVAKRDAESKFRLEQQNLGIAMQVASIRDDSVEKERVEIALRKASIASELTQNISGEKRAQLIAEQAAIAEREWKNQTAQSQYRIDKGGLTIAGEVADLRDDSVAKQIKSTDAQIALLEKESKQGNRTPMEKLKIETDIKKLKEQQWNNELAHINKIHAVVQANAQAGQGIGARAGREVNLKILADEEKKLEDLKNARRPAGEIAAQKAIVNQKQRGVEQDRHGVDLALEAMDIQIRTAGIKMTASERVARLAENEANYQQKIAQALRDQDSAMANRLSKEKAMKALQIEADELLKSPKQKADEAKEQRKKNQALATAAARKKARDEAAAREKAKFMADNALRVAHGFAPLPMPDHFGPVRAGDALGEAARQKILDAANREAIPIKPGEKKADVAEMKVVNLIVKALKSD